LVDIIKKRRSIRSYKDKDVKDEEIYTLKDTEQLAVVITDMKKYRPKKAVKKTLSIPYWLNELAEKEHINFSGVLQEALKKRLGV